MASHAWHLDHKTSVWLFSERLYYKGRKRRSIQTVVQSKKAAQDWCKALQPGYCVAYVHNFPFVELGTTLGPMNQLVNA